MSNNTAVGRARRLRRSGALLATLTLGIFLLAGVPSTAIEPTTAPAETVTFARDIAPILNANCVSCHHAGGSGPFALTTYQEAAKHATMLAQVTTSKQMPPWKAEAGYGTFLNERHLTAEQISLFERWADAGAPAGDLSIAPATPTFDAAEGWTLGPPDLVVKMPRPFVVPASGHDVYRCFVLPLNLPEDKYVSAVEYRPSNKTVVHHALFFLDQKGAARALEKRFHDDRSDDKQDGYVRFGSPGFQPGGGLGGWAPGATPSHLPDNVARELPKGSDLIVQTHFHPTGKPESEQSTIGIYFAKKPPAHTLLPLVLGNRSIDIQPGEAAHVVTADWTTPADVTLIGVTPHAHLVCKSMDVWATLPKVGDTDGEKVPLIKIDDWDFNWQGNYRYATPLRIPAGSTLHLRYVYDNSADNIRNPNTPPKRVRMGEQTTDEMAYCFLEGYADRPWDALTLRLSMARQLRQSRQAPAAAAK